MARPTNRLTHRFVTTMKQPGLHADGGGLYLEVDKSGVGKRWTFIFQWRGARKQMGLGGLAVTSLAEAREIAEEARRQVAKSINPIEAKKAAQVKGVTFADVADDLLKALAPEWKNAKHLYQWKQSLTVDAASLRPLAVDAVSTEDVLDALKPIWSVKPETASRTRGRIERVSCEIIQADTRRENALRRTIFSAMAAVPVLRRMRMERLSCPPPPRPG
ncbi:Arm DNA-binding domain-containing protein [Brevundimonas sp.]|uniref:Arm DNA-binding domain-containing protein n=1 Tax=Brevundimonas sp. TaxID=1871086 RepID=UPI001ACCE216|nr:Arm DNA-binding domain-containing protein [Brevundimonas sp.]MBN9465069.1 DUF4102 domain-containing protein [Brevundimonas sp.]